MPKKNVNFWIEEEVEKAFRTFILQKTGANTGDLGRELERAIECYMASPQAQNAHTFSIPVSPRVIGRFNKILAWFKKNMSNAETLDDDTIQTAVFRGLGCHDPRTIKNYRKLLISDGYLHVTELKFRIEDDGNKTKFYHYEWGPKGNPKKWAI